MNIIRCLICLKKVKKVIVFNMPINLKLEALDTISNKQTAQESNKPPKVKNWLDEQGDAYRAHQDAIRKAGQLISDITKGVQAREKPEVLVLKAIKCISLMTGDSLFYEQNKRSLKDIYGIDTSEGILCMENITLEELEKFLDEN